jgi:hypothetical protein
MRMKNFDNVGACSDADSPRFTDKAGRQRYCSCQRPPRKLTINERKFGLRRMETKGIIVKSVKLGEGFRFDYTKRGKNEEV